MSNDDSLHAELERSLGLDTLVGDSDSVQAAYDAGACRIGLAPSYDPTAESYPITCDADRPLVIAGHGPGVSQLGHDAVRETPVLDVVGHGAHTYKRAPTLRNVSVVGGSPAIRIRAAPFASLSNVYVDADGHGVHVAAGDDNSYGLTFFNVQAWNCGGDGFRLDADAGPHSAQFYGCHATACGGVGFRIRGYNTNVHGGTSQLNHSHGFDVRSPVASIRDVYVEGNGRKEEYPVEIYGKAAHGLAVENCYFHGATPRDVWHDYDTVRRGVNLHESASVTVEQNVFRKYGDAFFAGFDCEDVERARNYALDGTAET